MNDFINLFGPGILLAAPILYAALGGLFTQRAGIFNIALEGFMLLAAYFSISAAISTGSLLWGTLAGVAAAVVASAVMAVLVVGFQADEVIVGIAVNVFALGLTTFLLSNAQHSGKQLALPSGYPTYHLSWLSHIGVLRAIFGDRDLLVWMLIPSVVAVAYVLRRTGFGLRLKAVGEAPLAARAAGVRVAGVRFLSVLISGAFCGLAGAELAIGSVHLFSENMTSGRGIIAFAAVIFGAGLVSRTAAACLLFGIAQALAALLQIRTSLPSQFVLMTPFLLTIIAITTSDALRVRRSWPKNAKEPSSATMKRSDLARVAIAGHLSIDEIRLPDGTILPQTIGGAAAYAALGAFLAQGEVFLLARVGDDYPTHRLDLEHQDGGRIHTEAVSVVPGRSIHNIAHYGAHGDRAYEIEDLDVLTDQTPVPEDLAALDTDLDGRWVLVTPATLPQQRTLVQALKAAGALVALDTELHYLTEPDSFERLRDITRMCDCFLPSAEHIQHLFGAEIGGSLPAELAELAGLVRRFDCPITIVKRGSRGAVVFDRDTPDGATVAAVPDLALADPTGAGDGFNGGCLVGLARGEGTLDAAVTGCVAASFVIQAIGIAVPDTFSNQARLERYRQCVGTEAVAIERDELV
jgi:ABC-type uncharacterized transport system permease subunit/sugar/nucleoside kinase (ribokinase family)